MSRFAECPICFESFHVTLLESHAGRCNGVVKTKKKRKRNNNSSTKKKKKRKCPICQKSVYEIEIHASTCGEVRPTTKLKSDKQIEINGEVIRPTTKINVLKSDKQKNAFTELMGKRMRIAPVSKRLPGCHLFENFLTVEEEKRLVRKLDSCDPKWHISSWNGKCESKTWGLEVDVVKRIVGKVRRPIPKAFKFVIERMTSGEYLPLAGFVPNECNSNSYKREEGHWLRAHVDDRQLSGELLANISLLSDSYMTYRHEKTGEEVRVRLPRRSLQVVSKESRYDWTHEIRKVDVLDKRRVSITFRGNGQTKGSKRAPPVGTTEYIKYTL